MTDWAQVLTNLDVRAGEPMARRTTFLIGGPADFLLIAHSASDIAQAMKAAVRAGETALVIGNGSNLLVRDGGIRGLVIAVGEGMREISVRGNTIVAQAGASMRKTALAARDAGLSGLECLAGIPGNVGGALAMNAGAYGGEIAQAVESVDAVTRMGECISLARDDLAFGYRSCALSQSGMAAVEARFALTPDDPKAIGRRMEDFTARRTASQPLNLPSAGSVFKRPEGAYAAKLIDDAGLKGLSVGGAQVSQKHAGFIVNTGGATAADVLALIELVREAVHARFGIWLETEIRVLGEDIKDG